MLRIRKVPCSQAVTVTQLVAHVCSWCETGISPGVNRWVVLYVCCICTGAVLTMMIELIETAQNICYATHHLLRCKVSIKVVIYEYCMCFRRKGSKVQPLHQLLADLISQVTRGLHMRLMTSRLREQLFVQVAGVSWSMVQAVANVDSFCAQ